MARPRSIDVARVLDAARDGFAAAGLKRTLMADIARSAGISTGSLYNIAASKEALFLAMFSPEEALDPSTLPLPTPSFEELSARIAARLRLATELPLLREALELDRAPDIRAELHTLVAERYGVVSRSWKLLAAIEQTAQDYPEVFEAYFRRGRNDNISSLARYLEQREGAGQIRPLLNATSTARFVIEAVTWWAWHRHEDPDSQRIDDLDALAITQDMITAALITQ